MSNFHCTVCGAKDSQLVDGLMYCNNCNTQIEHVLLYEQDDDTTVNVRGKIRIKKQRGGAVDKTIQLEDPYATLKRRRKDDMYESMGRKSEAVTTNSDAFNNLRDDIMTAAAHTPVYLRRVGSRIATFSKMLAKMSVMMKVDLDFPESYPQQCLCVFERYLAHCEVAFTTEEYTEDLEKMFKTIVLNTNVEFEKERERKTKLIEAKAKGMSMLSQSQNPFADIVGGTLNEDLAMTEQNDDESENENEPRVESGTSAMKMVHSKIATESLINAARIHLEMDAMVAILHIAAMTLGCRWVMISDIVRWLREDRAGLSNLQFLGVGQTNLVDGEVSCNNRSDHKRLELPLYELFRTELWIWQSVELFSDRISIDIDQLIARVLYNLNLPEEFMSRVRLLMDLAPISLDLDKDALCQQGDVYEGMTCKEFSFCNRKNIRSSKSAAILRCFGRGLVRSTDSDVLFPVETKIMTYVLLALKLMYGLDDTREHDMSDQRNDDDEPVFDVVEWIYQLEMRMHLWEGQDVPDVVQQYRPLHPLLADEPFGDSRKVRETRLKDSDTIVQAIEYRSRDRGFRQCVPSTLIKDSCYAAPNPFPDETSYFKKDRNDDDAIYAPLRFQTKLVRAHWSRPRTTEQKKFLEDRTDKAAVGIVKKDYSMMSMCHPAAPPVARPDQYLAAVISKERCDSSKSAKLWTEQFPASAGYIRYPRPLWAQFGIRTVKSASRAHYYNKKVLQETVGTGTRDIYASRLAAKDTLAAAEPYMSKNFATLFKILAKTIGEADYVLYTAFMMLELQIVDRARFSEVCEKIIEGETLPLECIRRTKEGTSANLTVPVTSYLDIDRRQELSLIQLGVPRNWAVSVWDIDEDDDSWGESSEAEDDSDKANGSSGSEDVPSDDVSNDAQQSSGGPASSAAEPAIPTPSAKRRLLGSSDDSDDNTPNPQPPNRITGHPKKLKDCREHTNYVFEFDTMWHLLTMRYW